ncbi:RNA polymerase subunit sigma-24, partial [Saccharothrix sp. MB29]|nr:RNA polymerase subunit sigma-24 [Saccharothrix sp. MB29]
MHREPDRPPPDAELVERVSAGDRAAFGELYDRYAKPAYSLARRICVVIALAYLGGYTQIEVAALTGIPLGTVKSRTFAAIRRLRTTLHAVWAGETGGETPGRTTG